MKPVHALCTDGATACGRYMVNVSEPINLDAVTCEECRASFPFQFQKWLEAAELADEIPLP